MKPQMGSPVKAAMACMACGSSGEFEVFEAREMLLGTREMFDYGECPSCASLQIRAIPGNLSDYYPADYPLHKPAISRRHKRRALRKASARWLLDPHSRVAGWVAKTMAGKYPFFEWCRLAGCDLDSAILDLGCGNGGLLRRMQRYGFQALSGLDPYAPVEANEPGFSVRRADLSAATHSYDLIMMHHVLEHLPDPKAALVSARSRLKPGGKVLVRVPVAASETWRIYQEHWSNLDPPRHLLVPSVKGMWALAASSGLKVLHTGWDGTEYAFLVSGHYSRGTPYTERPPDSPSDRRRFRQRAEEANRRGDGDQGVFLLAAA
jgi:2-polyprenyl-3-methyl-5-hydroxy-6-metoxy-1,4-benzoquinol methylase